MQRKFLSDRSHLSQEVPETGCGELVSLTYDQTRYNHGYGVQAPATVGDKAPPKNTLHFKIPDSPLLDQKNVIHNTQKAQVAQFVLNAPLNSTRGNS